MSIEVFGDCRILIADADFPSSKLLAEILLGFGVNEVILENTFSKVVSQVSHGNVDCVLMDIALDGQEDFETLKYIRRTKDFPCRAIPIIICTGCTSFNEISGARDFGASEICAKPVNPKVLLKNLASAVFKTREFVDHKNYIGPCRRRKRTEYLGNERRDNLPLDQGLIDQVMGENV